MMRVTVGWMVSQCVGLSSVLTQVVTSRKDSDQELFLNLRSMRDTSEGDLTLGAIRLSQQFHLIEAHAVFHAASNMTGKGDFKTLGHFQQPAERAAEARPGDTGNCKPFIGWFLGAACLFTPPSDCAVRQTRLTHGDLIKGDTT